MYRARIDSWYLERVIWLLAGAVCLGSSILAWLHSVWWIILTAIVGVNLIVFSLTGFCVMANVLHRVGFRSQTDEKERC